MHFSLLLLHPVRNMIKRYSIAPDTFLGVSEHPEGSFVFASDYDACNRYALQLVTYLAERFPAVENWKPLPDLMGKLTQIDNMVARLHHGYGANPHATETEAKP